MHFPCPHSLKHSKGSTRAPDMHGSRTGQSIGASGVALCNQLQQCQLDWQVSGCQDFMPASCTGTHMLKAFSDTQYAVPTDALAPAAAEGQVAIVLGGLIGDGALDIEALRVKDIWLVP